MTGHQRFVQRSERASCHPSRLFDCLSHRQASSTAARRNPRARAERPCRWPLAAPSFFRVAAASPAAEVWSRGRQGQERHCRQCRPALAAEVEMKYATRGASSSGREGNCGNKHPSASKRSSEHIGPRSERTSASDLSGEAQSVPCQGLLASSALPWPLRIRWPLESRQLSAGHPPAGPERAREQRPVPLKGSTKSTSNRDLASSSFPTNAGSDQVQGSWNERETRIQKFTRIMPPK